MTQITEEQPAAAASAPQAPTPPATTVASPTAATVQSSLEDVWYLKPVAFTTKDGQQNVKIITQNFNGPCSFIAICNILILRGSIQILPETRTTVSYEFLSQLVGEYLLLNCPGVDVSAALSILPHTQKGMDLNPLFTSPTAFRPGGTGGELKLFEHVGIPLMHGWLVDPDSAEAVAITKTQDYDTSVTLIAEADHVANGKLVVHDEEVAQPAGPSGEAGPSRTSRADFSEEDKATIENAILVRRFLDTTQSQLTYHGLFELASTLKPGSLVALFRNLHLSVLHKPEGDDSLYTLVTDQVFVNEPSVVWERLEDVDGGWSTFVDSNFVKATPAGGDFAGQTAEDTARRYEQEELAQMAVSEPGDLELARQLQEDERRQADHETQQAYVEQQKQELQRMAKQSRQKDKSAAKKDKNCVIM